MDYKDDARILGGEPAKSIHIRLEIPADGVVYDRRACRAHGRHFGAAVIVRNQHGLSRLELQGPKEVVNTGARHVKCEPVGLIQGIWRLLVRRRTQKMTKRQSLPR